MLNILIEHSNKSQIYSNSEDYFELIKYMISNDFEGNLNFQYKFETL